MAQIESLTADAIIALINAGTWPQVFAPVVGTTVLLNDAVAADVRLASNVVIGLKNIGSAASAAGAAVFEASVNSTNGVDGDWVSVQAVRTDSNTIENGRAVSSLAAATAQAYGWELAVNGFTYFRVRCSALLTAGANFQWTIARGAYATEPVPAIQTHPITGQVTTTPLSGAGSSYSLITTASLNASSIKAGTGGSVFEFSCFNATAALIHAKFYDKNGVPAPATDSSLLRAVYPIPAGAMVNVEFGAIGKKFSSGISLATTALVAATDATVIGAGAVINYTYI